MSVRFILIGSIESVALTRVCILSRIHLYSFAGAFLLKRQTGFELGDFKTMRCINMNNAERRNKYNGTYKR